MSNYTGGPATDPDSRSGLPTGGEVGDLLVIDSVTGQPVWDDTPLLSGSSNGIRFTIVNTGTGGCLLLINTSSPILAALQIAAGGKAIVANGGDIEVGTIGTGFILKSPDGTRYRISVANGGALSAVAV